MVFEPWDDIENLTLNQNRKAWKQEGAGLLGDSGLRSLLRWDLGRRAGGEIRIKSGDIVQSSEGCLQLPDWQLAGAPVRALKE